MITAEQAKRLTDEVVLQVPICHHKMRDEINHSIQVSVSNGKYETTILRDNLPIRDYYEALGYKVHVSEKYGYVKISWK